MRRELAVVFEYGRVQVAMAAAVAATIAIVVLGVEEFVSGRGYVVNGLVGRRRLRRSAIAQRGRRESDVVLRGGAARLIGTLEWRGRRVLIYVDDGQVHSIVVVAVERRIRAEVVVRLFVLSKRRVFVEHSVLLLLESVRRRCCGARWQRFGQRWRSIRHASVVHVVKIGLVFAVATVALLVGRVDFVRVDDGAIVSDAAFSTALVAHGVVVFVMDGVVRVGFTVIQLVV